MLCPVPKHHDKTSENEGNDKYHQCRFKIQKAKTCHDHHKSDFTHCDLSVHFFSLTPEEIHKRVMEAKKHKPQPIRYEIGKTVAVIAHRTTCVLRHIIL